MNDTRKTSRLPHPRAVVSSPAHTSKLFILFPLALMVAFIFLAGCAAQPNSNLTASACCPKQTAPYTCHILLDNKGNQQHDSKGNLELSQPDCGICFGLDSSGTPLGQDGQPLKDSAGKIRGPSACSNNCNFRSADCSNSDSLNSCYAVSGQTVDTTNTVAPICADATPNPCLQNNCTAMICGKPVAKARTSLDNYGIQSLTTAGQNDNAFSAEANAAKQKGLVGLICEFKPLDTNTNRLLKSTSWWVNSLRLGISGSFSDYDRARYYLPVSDYFCPNANPNAVVDRFTSYLTLDTRQTPPVPSVIPVFRAGTPGNCVATHQQGWCTSGTKRCDTDPECDPDMCDSPPPSDGYACDVNNKFYSTKSDCQAACMTPDLNFKAPMSFCKLNSDPTDPLYDLAKPFYYCASACTSTDPTCGSHYAATGSSASAALLACNQACKFNKLKTCQQNPDLITTLSTISPPDNAKIQQPFVDINAYANDLQKVYADIPPASGDCHLNPDDPSCYYKSQLPSNPTDDKGILLDCAQILSQPSIDCTKAPTDNYCKCQTFIAATQTSLKTPGPAAAKVFECSSSSDCLSGSCDTSSYSRSTCFDNSGKLVDCGCRVVTDCDKYFNCNQYPGFSGGQGFWSVAAAICASNDHACHSATDSGNPAIVCDYKTDFSPSAKDQTPDPLGTYPAKAGPGNTCFISDTNQKNYDGNSGPWGVLDFGEFSGNYQAYSSIGYSNIEMATLQDQSVPPILGGSTGPSPPKTWHDIPNACSDSRGLQRAWAVSFYPAPSEQTVNGQWGQRNIITSPYVTWQNSNCGLSLSGYTDTGADCATINGVNEVKFPLVHNCQMTVGNLEAAQTIPGRSNPPVTEVVPVTNEMLPGLTNPSIDVESPNDNQKTAGVWPGTRANKTWVINNFGDCQQNAQGPVVQTYGLCKPCGTMLTMAYQKVTTWDNSNAPAPFGPPNGYCPGGCSGGPSTSMFCNSCNSAYPSDSVSPMSQGSPDTNPEYGFLVNKIDEYQSAGVMPVLDLHQYGTKNAATGVYELLPSAPVKVSTQSDSFCSQTGGIPGDSTCTPDPNNPNGPCTGSTWDCTYPALHNWLFAFLAKNHSSSVLIAGDLPADCALADTDACQAIQAKLTTIKGECPDCLTALEYPGPSKPSLTVVTAGTKDAEFGTSSLYKALHSYAPPGTLANYYADKFNSPWIDSSSTLTAPPGFPAPNLLVLDVDLSGAPSTSGDCSITPLTTSCQALDDQIMLTLNTSRHVMQSIGWPTIWKLTYDPTQITSPGAYSQQSLYAALYRHQRELSLVGVVGVLLPPMDEQGLSGTNLASVSPTNGMLITSVNPPTDIAGVRGGTDPASSPFCAAQASSGQFLHPQVISALQQIYARPSGQDPKTGAAIPATCACQACTLSEYAAGKCGGTSGSNICTDGQPCNLPNGDVSTVGSDYKCEPLCVRSGNAPAGSPNAGQPYCPICNSPSEANLHTTCTAVTSSNKAPVACCTSKQIAGQDNCAEWPNCELISNLRLGSLSSDPNAPPPPSASILGGLPVGFKCCLQAQTGPNKQSTNTIYTYQSSATIGLSSEPDIFPAFGANTSDCGRVPTLDADQQSAVCSGTAPAPLPISSKLWTCTVPS